jgi:hypothetical protein
MEVIYDDPVIWDRPFRVDREGSKPMLSTTDAWGKPTSGFLVGEEDVWVVGRNVPAHGELPTQDHDERLLDVHRATAAHANSHRGRSACFTGPRTGVGLFARRGLGPLGPRCTAVLDPF